MSASAEREPRYAPKREMSRQDILDAIFDAYGENCMLADTLNTKRDRLFAKVATQAFMAGILQRVAREVRDVR